MEIAGISVAAMIGPLAGAIVIGVVVGILAGMLGIGGGVLMIPFMRLVMGLNPLQCTATSLFAIVLTSLGGTVARIREKLCVPRIGVVVGIAGCCASPLGVYLATLSPDWAVMAAAAACMVFSAGSTLWKMKRAEKQASGQADCASTVELTPRNVVIMVCLGLIAGLGSGYAGLGGGFIIVPLLMWAFDLSMKLSSGTSLVAITFIAIPGAIAQALSGNLVWWVGLALAVGTVPGSFVGARLAKIVNNRVLGLLFSCLLCVVAVLLVLNELGVF